MTNLYIYIYIYFICYDVSLVVCWSYNLKFGKKLLLASSFKLLGQFHHPPPPPNCCVASIGKEIIHQYVKMTLDKHIIFCKHVYIHVHVHFVIFCVNWTSCQLFRFEAKIYRFYCISIGSASILWCQSNNSQNIDRSRRIWGTIPFCPMVPFNNFVYLIVGVRAVKEENILYLTFFFN